MFNNSVLSKVFDSLASTDYKFNHTLLLRLFLLGSLLITGKLYWNTSHFSSWVSKRSQSQLFFSLVSGEEYQWITQIAFFSLFYEILANHDRLVYPIVKLLHDLTGKPQLLAKIAALERDNISLRIYSLQLTSDRELMCRRLLKLRTKVNTLQHGLRSRKAEVVHLKKHNSALRDAVYCVHQDHRMAMCILKIKEQRACNALAETKEEKKKLKKQLRAIVRYNEDVVSMARQLALSYKNIKNAFVSRKSVYKKQIWHLQSKLDSMLVQAVIPPAKPTNEPVMELTEAHALEPRSLERILPGVDSSRFSTKDDHPEATIHDKLIEHSNSQNADETITILSSGSPVLAEDFPGHDNLLAMMPEHNAPRITENFTLPSVAIPLATRDSTSAHTITVTGSLTSGISASEPFWQARSTRTWSASSSIAPFFKPNALQDWFTDLGRR